MMYRYTLADHKTGHMLMSLIATEISRISGESVRHRIFYRFNLPANNRDKWVAIIRHPYEVITSGYKYHKTCNEWWAIQPNTNFYEYATIDARNNFPQGNLSEHGNTYQKILNGLPEESGLEYEMRNVGRLTVEAMYNWVKLKPEAYVVNYESFLFSEINYELIIKEMLIYLEISKIYHDDILFACNKFNLLTKSKEDIEIDAHVTNKEPGTYAYKKMWKPHHYNVAAEIFPGDLLITLGYEK